MDTAQKGVPRLYLLIGAVLIGALVLFRLLTGAKSSTGSSGSSSTGTKPQVEYIPTSGDTYINYVGPGSSLNSPTNTTTNNNTSNTATATAPGSSASAGNPPVVQKPPSTVPGHVTPTPSPAPAPVYVTVAHWTANNPPWNSYLGGIASHYGTTVQALLRLNPYITNPNLIYAGNQVRVR